MRYWTTAYGSGLDRREFLGREVRLAPEFFLFTRRAFAAERGIGLEDDMSWNEVFTKTNKKTMCHLAEVSVPTPSWRQL